MRPLRLSLVVALLATTPALAFAQLSRAGSSPSDSVTNALALLSLDSAGLTLNGDFTYGAKTVAKGDTVRGPAVAVRGDLEVYGVVLGDAYALWGDVIVHDGARIQGSANAYRGRVILEGGDVRGALHAEPRGGAAAEAPRVPMTRSRALQLSAGWTAMLVVVGLLVLVFASANLELAVQRLESDFGRAFWIGLAAEFSFLPLLLLASVGLILTVLGILLVPFVLVVAPLLYIGMLTLGWLAVALLTGRAVTRSASSGSRGEAVRAIVLGTLVLMLPWAIAAAIRGQGIFAMSSTLAAFTVSWVAATAGLGAALLSRGGTTRPKTVAPAPVAGWQTPTPVAGVSAVRRPIPARPEVESR